MQFQDYTFGRNSTYAGVISGAGRVSQTGRGTLTLSGSNTYSGGTSPSAAPTTRPFWPSRRMRTWATRQVTSTSAAASSSSCRASTCASTRTVNLNNFGGTFALNGATTTFGGVIENAGRLTIEGPGTMTLTGANTYWGGTTVRDGAALAIGSDARLGTGDLALDGGTPRYLATFDLSNTRPLNLNTGGGTFDTNGFDTTISQVIGGTGGLTKAGAGTLTLTGINTYLGPTAVSGGTLVGSTDNLRGDIVNNGAVVFDQGFTSETYAGVMSGSGSPDEERSRRPDPHGGEYLFGWHDPQQRYAQGFVGRQLRRRHRHAHARRRPDGVRLDLRPRDHAQHRPDGRRRHAHPERQHSDGRRIDQRSGRVEHAGQRQADLVRDQQLQHAPTSEERTLSWRYRRVPA